jgi:hypothetical protein
MPLDYYASGAIILSTRVQFTTSRNHVSFSVKTAQIPGHFIQCDSKDYPFTVGNIAGTIPHYYAGLQVMHSWSLGRLTAPTPTALVGLR